MKINGLIIKQISNLYTVINLETGEKINALASGKLRYVKIEKNNDFNKTFGRSNKKSTKIIKISPKVGDKVLIEKKELQNVITQINSRKNELIRPDIANIDQVLLVFSCIKPEFSFNLLDKFLIILEKEKLNVTLVVSKIDLIEKDILDKLKETLFYYEEKLKIKIYYVNSKQKIGFDVLTTIFENKITVLAGQTGVGKSTLLNALIPELKLKTDEISKALGRGKHTTRHSQLYEFNNGYICDTPGFSKIDNNIFNKDELKYLYPDFINIAADCKFSSCNHINEPNCKIKELIGKDILKSRYENYYKFYFEIENKKEKY